MKINCYQNFVKRSNETLRPTGAGVEKEVVLKNATSITSPTFVLSGFDPSMNYIAVPSWGRNYFVVDYQKGNNDLYEVQCEEDYAGTWKGDIATYNCFVERASDPSYYNTDIADDALSVEDVVEHQSEASTELFTTTGAYILRLVGRDTSGIATFAFNNLSAIGNIFNPIFSNRFDDGSFNWQTLNVGDLVQAVLCDPSKYITGAYYSPVALGDYAGHGGYNQVYLGFYPTGQSGLQVSTDPVITKSVTLSVPAGIYSDFRKTDRAFSEYTIYIPAIGTVSLSPDIMDSTLTLDAAIDLLTGNVFYKLSANNALVATYNGNCYAPLQIGNGDASGGTAFISDVISAGKGVVSKNVEEATKGVIQGIKDFITPTPSINGSRGGVASMKYKPDVVISVLQKHSAEFPTSQYGRPCCKNLTLGNLSGYIKCGNASIDIAGTKTEKDAVNNLLNSGFYFT